MSCRKVVREFREFIVKFVQNKEEETEARVTTGPVGKTI
jgi:hypothetical protein